MRGGGTLVTLDSASDLPIDLFGIGIRNVLKNVSRSEYFCPGGLLRATADPADPLVWGMPANFTVFAERGPAFDLTNGDDDDDEGEESPAAAPVVGGKPRIAARFAEKDVLYSGWLLGEGKIAKKGILAEVPLGKGRVIMLGVSRAVPRPAARHVQDPLQHPLTAPAVAARPRAAARIRRAASAPAPGAAAGRGGATSAASVRSSNAVQPAVTAALVVRRCRKIQLPPPAAAGAWLWPTTTSSR